ncbi:hypothetical protein Trydic_g5136 [Trypoxylus dichotomus]
MSGNTQPRRRKDKKKKKDEQIEEAIVQSQPLPTPTIPNDDTNIHVHKERSLGGGVCARCVFFLLMIIISVIIGLTITDYHGQTDVEIPESESRFARIFEGWIEKSGDTHEDDDHEHAHSDEISHEDEEDQDHDEEDAASEEAEDEETEEIEESQQEDEEEELEDEEEVSPEESQEIQDDEDEENLIESEEEEEDIPAEESEQEEQEIAQESEEELQQDEDDEDPIYVKSEENDEDEEEETTEPDEKEDTKIKDDEREADNLIEEENPETNTANMAAKVGVGISLFIVAYVVLVKKWKTDKPFEDDTIKEDQIPSDLTRRNTFVPPPTLEEVEQDIENLEEEYSDEEEIEESDEDRRTVPASKRQYEELRTTYHRSLTPDSDNEYRKKKYEESEDDEEGENEDDDYGDHEQYEEEVEEEEEEEEEYEDDEDEELMKKLEARYGKLDSKSSQKYVQQDEDEEVDKHFRFKKSDSEFSKPKSAPQKAYEFRNITNANDYAYRDDLDEAQKHLIDNVQVALSLFTKFLKNRPDSPRALYGKAQALDSLAEKKRSNEVLQESIQFYLQVLNVNNVPDALFVNAAERCINRMRFIGNYGRAISVHKKLIERFPQEVTYKNDLAVTYLTINRIAEARNLLIDILSKFPNDGFALVHYGFILKTVDNNLSEAIDHMRKGIESRDPGVIDGRFYFHLGDALARLGKNNEAMKVYEDGVLNKVFLSKYQRSLYNVGRLTARPWWNKEQIPYTKLFEQLEQNYQTIREEGLAVLNKRGYFKDESENLRDVGDWKQFELYARGLKHAENCKKTPITCKIIDSEPDARGCRRGQVKFSVMHPGTHVWPHCGPTNCRLRIHLGLKVPPKTYIRVAEETRTWEEGKIFIFDDSFEHEVWHNGTEFRLVLIIDVWHPELSKNEKHNLSAI